MRGLIVARQHLSSFPAGQELTPDTIEEANDFLVYCINGRTVKARDMILIPSNFSETTVTPSTVEFGLLLQESQQYLTIVTSIRSKNEIP